MISAANTVPLIIYKPTFPVHNHRNISLYQITSVIETTMSNSPQT